jgi:hypothetical protein
MKKGHETVRMWTRIGAIAGAIGFLAFGVVPGFYFGSYGALILMSHLFGSVQPTVLLRVATAAGIVLGVTCVGFMSIVVGSILGTAIGYAARALTASLKEKAPAEAGTASAKTE